MGFWASDAGVLQVFLKSIQQEAFSVYMEEEPCFLLENLQVPTCR